VVDAARYSEDDLLPAIEAGADDVVADESVLEVLAAPADFQAVRAALEQSGVEIDSAELTMRPTNEVMLEEDRIRGVLRLIEAFEDLDDVTAVHANFEADAEALERAAA
jgi:transcriptional/translational regulatory protein YebC/TACO1